MKIWDICVHTFSCPSVLSVRSLAANSLAVSASTSPTRRPSSTTGRNVEPDTEGHGLPRGVIPREVKSRGRCVVLGVVVVTRQAAARWFNRPHGAPSGVWTGHRKPRMSVENYVNTCTSHGSHMIYTVHVLGRGELTLILISSFYMYTCISFPACTSIVFCKALLSRSFHLCTNCDHRGLTYPCRLSPTSFCCCYLHVHIIMYIHVRVQSVLNLREYEWDF